MGQIDPCPDLESPEWGCPSVGWYPDVDPCRTRVTDVGDDPYGWWADACGLVGVVVWWLDTIR